MKYAFFLGHQPQISIAEILAVFSRHSIEASLLSSNLNCAIFNTNAPIDAQKFMAQLGGTISIAEEVPTKTAIRQQTETVDVLSAYLDNIVPEGKIVFSFHGNDRVGLAIKKHLKQLGRSVRFVSPKNSATIIHNGLIEAKTDLHIIEQSLYVTKAVQPIDDFSHRDYGRPGTDGKSGMLPPKLARILINLSGVSATQGVLLDPFCGSGTILMEAALLGFTRVFGSDASEKAIQDTKQNLTWIQEEFRLPRSVLQNYTVFQSDARSVHKRIPTHSVNAIISEPYMGKPLTGKESKQDLVRQIEELRSLYLESFSSFSSVLSSQGTIIFIVPEFRYNEEWISIDVLEPLKQHSFVPVSFADGSSSLLYWRKGQFLGRRIWKFIKK